MNVALIGRSDRPTHDTQLRKKLVKGGRSRRNFSHSRANQNYTHHDNYMTPNPMTLDLWRVSRDHGMAESRFCVLAHIIDAFSDYLCLKKKRANLWNDCNTMPYGRCQGRIRVRWSRLLSLDDLASPFQVSTYISVLFADVEFRIHFQERVWCQKICYEASHVTKLPFSGD